MANEDSIIIKKIKKGGHGHHGGAWKVAYADFVTAMMAFFLLLWLLSSTSKEQKAGLADYFTPTTGIQDARGIGKKGGLSPSPEGRKRTDLSDPGIVVGRLPQGPDPSAPEKKIDNVPKDTNTGVDVKVEAPADPTPPADPFSKKKETEEEELPDAAEFERVEENIMNAFEQTPDIQSFKENIVIAHTPEGLKIDMVDSDKQPMFAPGNALMTDTGRRVIEAISNIVATTTNRISISGHTDANDYSVGENYSSWELSADRANAARRYLVNTGLNEARFAKVEGLADRDLLVPNQPNSPRNRRVSLTLMRDNHMKQSDITPTSRGLLSLPSAIGGGGNE